MRVTEKLYPLFFHYPRYPWEQKGSHGSCIVMIPPLVYPLRAKRSALCFTIPVLAEELVYRELFFFPSHRFPWAGS